MLRDVALYRAILDHISDQAWLKDRDSRYAQSGVLLRRPFNKRGATCPPRPHHRRHQDRTRNRGSNSST
jgi:hypothetical protein